MTVVSPVDLTQVDAFADKPFSGNPAAVCLLCEPRDEHWMRTPLERRIATTTSSRGFSRQPLELPKTP